MGSKYGYWKFTYFSLKIIGSVFGELGGATPPKILESTPSWEGQVLLKQSMEWNYTTFCTSCGLSSFSVIPKLPASNSLLLCEC